MNKGFATLFIVIILGSAALSLSLMLASSATWLVRGAREEQDHFQAKASANACAEMALDLIRENISFTGTGSKTIGNSDCAYSVLSNGNISVTGTSGASTKKINIILSTFSPVTISSWKEVP